MYRPRRGQLCRREAAAVAVGWQWGSPRWGLTDFTKLDTPGNHQTTNIGHRTAPPWRGRPSGWWRMRLGRANQPTSCRPVARNHLQSTPLLTLLPINCQRPIDARSHWVSQLVAQIYIKLPSRRRQAAAGFAFQIMRIPDANRAVSKKLGLSVAVNS